MGGRLIFKLASAVEFAGGDEEEECAGALDGCGDPKGGCEACVFGHDTAQEYSDAHAEVPRDEYRRVCRAALVVTC